MLTKGKAASRVIKLTTLGRQYLDDKPFWQILGSQIFMQFAIDLISTVDHGVEDQKHLFYTKSSLAQISLRMPLTKNSRVFPKSLQIASHLAFNRC